MNANTMYVLTGETTCVNMRVSFTELTINSETLQALSGMWEFFLGGGGGRIRLQISKQHAV